MGKRRKRKQKKSSPLFIAVILAALCVFIFSAYQLIMLLIPYYSGSEEYDRIKELAITTDDDDEDTVAWIRFVEPSIISYPVVKSSDNTEYLTKTFSANDNKLGAIFMDMNCASDFTSKNTLIYGHNLKVGGEMFSQLKSYEDESFCQQYPYFYIYTPDGKERTYQVFSAGTVKATAENYNLVYESDEAFSEYIALCRSSSNYQVDVEVGTDSQIVSLSTCTNVNEDERFLLQGVLIKEIDS